MCGLQNDTKTNLLVGEVCAVKKSVSINLTYTMCGCVANSVIKHTTLCLKKGPNFETV